MTTDQSKNILKALDSLATALADHGHQWTDEQRALYNQAVTALQPKAAVDVDRKQMPSIGRVVHYVLIA